MKRLGYTRFVAQGGDWGAIIANPMGVQAPPELVGIHSNMPGVLPLEIANRFASAVAEPAPAGLSAEEQRCYEYHENPFGFFDAKGVSVLAAVTVFPRELYQAPRSWTERPYHNLIYYNQPDKGGHFAAWEQPQLFSEEVRAAFRSLR